jgi:hypothetical protein
MAQIRELYLNVAESAAKLLAAPQVAAAWHEPSALAKLSVQGLAGHLAGQIFFIPKVLAEPVPAEEVIPLHEYYARVSWIGSDLDDPFNVLIRTSGEQDAADGPAALVARVEATVDELRAVLPTAPSRPVRRPTWGAWSISLDDFVTSRLLEVVVHCDDLAYSVGVPAPELPAQAIETVVDVLSRIAIRRHGATNVLRALSRAERAPASISAL